MLTGIDKNEVFAFIPSREQGAENPTTFLIGVLTNRDKVRLMTGSADENGQIDVERLSERAVDIVRASLRGVKNFNGQAEIKEITEDLVESIPFDVLMEVFSRTIELNFMSASAKKN